MNIYFLFLGNFSDKVTTIPEYHILDKSNNVQNNIRLFLQNPCEKKKPKRLLFLFPPQPQLPIAASCFSVQE